MRGPIADGQPFELYRCAILLEWIEQRGELSGVRATFAKGAMEGGHDFSPCVDAGGGDFRRSLHESPDDLPARIGEVEAHEIRGVEIWHLVPVAVVGDEVGDVAVARLWVQRAAFHECLESRQHLAVLPWIFLGRFGRKRGFKNLPDKFRGTEPAALAGSVEPRGEVVRKFNGERAHVRSVPRGWRGGNAGVCAMLKKGVSKHFQSRPRPRRWR